MPIQRPVGVLALQGRVERAIAFAARTDVYVAFGRSTPWGDLPGETGLDDLNPPLPDPLAAGITEPLGYKQATLRLVKPDPDGPLRIYDTYWSVIDESEARSLGSPYVYVSTSFDYDELPLVTFRQLAVCSGLVKQGSVPLGQIALLPADVADDGVLEYLYNDLPMTRNINEQDVFDLILTF